jgi:plasmid stabilization system protein ParE
MKRAALAIERQFMLLEKEPQIGRPLDDMSDLRELITPFGESGYIALYRYNNLDDVVYILAFRHQKDNGALKTPKA